ncbi:MAG TPA: Sua5 family C-terminal domain-containing protein, partial [Ktedonobacteraceae bacterium]
AFADLNGRVPLILDSGPCEVGVESTVLDLCADVPTILRPGGVSLEELRAVLPDVQVAIRQTGHGSMPKDVHAEERGQKAPGQLLTHYAPAVPLLLFVGGVESMRSAMLAEVRRRREKGEMVGVLVADDDVSVFRGSGALVHSLGDAAAYKQVAAALFGGLRNLEAAGVEVILCRDFDEEGLGLAIHDRLLRAAAGKVVETG